MIDLHTHSSASDGSLCPSALIKEAVKRSLTAIALTDHDTIAGLIEAENTALELGIQFIPGIELEITWNRAHGGGEFHLLGLGINNPSLDFKKAVENLARQREERNLEIIEKMNNFGIVVSYEEIKAFAGSTTIGAEKAGGVSIGRPHFADYLISQRIVKNREQAFSRYLGNRKLFFIPKIGLDFNEAVRIIKQSGGIAVLAHPMSLYTAWGRLPDLIKNLKDNGLDGIEAWHPTAKVSSCKRLEELGKKLDLIVTAGSDFHGEARPDRKLGITAGGKKIEDSYLPKHILSN